jgi:hypothetical protein
MSANSPSYDGPSWLEDLNSMLVSASIHFTLFIILGLLTVAGAGGKHGNSLVMTLGGDGTGPAAGPDMNDVAAEGDPLADPAHLDKSVELAAALGPANELDVPSPIAATQIAVPDAVALAAAEVGGAGGLSQKGTDGTNGTALDASPIFGAIGGTGRGGGGTGDGKGTTGKASTEFFGIGGYGQTFVYVVDASDSMNDRGKFERARYELLKSIEQLTSEQRFYVIFYNESAYPMDAAAPLLATPDNVAKTTNWINQVEPTGGTNPLPALLLALTIRPDAIYFLSDGQFDPAVMNQLRFRNRPNLKMHIRQVPIHTIAFFDRIAEAMMRTIARNSGGEYNYVN